VKSRDAAPPTPTVVVLIRVNAILYP